MLPPSFMAVGAQMLRPLPLLRYLVLRTEAHAYCAGLAFFAMLAFYPFSLLMVSVAKYVFSSDAAHVAVREVLRALYPTSQEFLLRNLEASSWEFGEAMTLHTVVWVLLGAAGIFIPLETALNGLWGFPMHRPYWRNQLVGFLLTVACAGLAFVAVTALAAFDSHPLALGGIVFAYVASALFLLYRFLPNGPVENAWVIPGALAGAVALAAVRWGFLWSLPHLDLPESQGPYHVSVSFLLLAYFEAFAVLSGAYVAAAAARAHQATERSESRDPEPGPDAGPQAAEAD